MFLLNCTERLPLDLGQQTHLQHFNIMELAWLNTTENVNV